MKQTLRSRYGEGKFRIFLLAILMALVVPLVSRASHGTNPVSDIDYTGMGTRTGTYNHSTTDHVWIVFNANAGDVININMTTAFQQHYWLYRSTTGCIQPGNSSTNGCMTLVAQGGNGVTSGNYSYTVAATGQFAFQLDAYVGQSGSYNVTLSGSTATTTLCTPTAPTFTTCPGNISANATGSGANVNYTAVASGGNLTYSFSGATTGSGNGTGSGSNFNIGTTTVTITATNTCGSASTGTCSFTVTVHPPAGALNFDGVNDYVRITNPYYTFGKEITVEWSAIIDPSSQIGSGISQSTENIDGSNSMVWMMHYEPLTTSIRFFISDNGAWEFAQAPVPSGWHRFVGVASATGIKIYMDGALIATSADVVNTGILNVPNSVIHLGKDSRYISGRFMKGQIDEVRIWNRALCLPEIQNNNVCELNGSQTGLVEYYKFNHGFATANNAGVTTLTDASGNGTDGTLQNFALNGNTSNWVTGNASSACNAFLSPEINMSIANGDNTPSLADDTYFGTVPVGGNASKTFTIQNTGSATLNITGISITGANAGQFSSLPGASVVAPNSSTSFTVMLSPTSIGEKNATITVTTDDCDEPSYEFAIQGKAVVGPTNVNTGILTWLDASDVDADGNAGNNPSNNTAVSLWKDKSGNTNNATQLHNAGVYRTDVAINSNPVVRFSNSHTYNFSNIDIRANANPDLTVITVYRLTGQGHEGLWGNDNGNWDRFTLASFNVVGNNNGVASRGPNQSPPFTAIPNSGLTNQLYLFAATYDGNVSGGVNSGPANGSSFYFNGSLLGTFTDQTDPSAAQSTLRLGFDGDDGFLDGDIAEFIVYDRVLTACEIQQINTYLSTKYGVTFSTASITAGGATTFCQGGSVTLTASAGTAYQWKLNGNNISGANAQTYSATQTGNYSVDVTTSCGTATSATTSVTVNTLPVVSATSLSPVCVRDTIKLFSNPPGATYSWTGPNSFTSNAQHPVILNATAAMAGTYTVTVTDANSCSASANTTVVVKALPVVTASGNSPCDGGTINLNGGGAVNYFWNGPNNFSANTQNPSLAATAAASGTYFVKAEGANGCRDTASVNVTVHPLPSTPVITASGPTTFCPGGSVTLSTAATIGNTSFLNASAPGAQVTCDCPPGYVAVGYVGRTGAFMDQFQLACKQLNPNGTLGSTVVYTSTNGTSTGGGPNGPYLFSGTNVMTGLFVDHFSTFLTGIAGRGQSVAYIQASGSNATAPATLGLMTGAVITGNLGTLTVPDGHVVTGMIGHNGSSFSTGVALRYRPINDLLNNSSSTLLWSNGATTPSTTVNTAGSYTVTATTSNGCSATSAPTVVTLNTHPTFTSCPQNIVANNLAGTCAANIVYANLVAAAGSPAPTLSYSFTGATTGTGIGSGSGSQFNVGVTNVTITATNACGGTACSFTVTINDNQAPNAICQSATVQLDNAGMATVNAAQINNGSTDNCGVASVSLLAPNTSVNLVTNGSFTSGTSGWNGQNIDGNGGWRSTGGNPGSHFILNDNGKSFSDPTLFQTISGMVVGQQYQVKGFYRNTGCCGPVGTIAFGIDVNTNIAQLPNPGTNWTPFAVNFTAATTSATLRFRGEINGTDIDIDIDEVAVHPYQGVNSISYNCSNAGTNPVTLVVKDVNGNTASCNATVTVEDNILPVINCPGNVTVSCNASAAPAATGTATATDNCAVASVTHTDVSTQDANANAAGHYNYTITRTWKATDVNGKFSTCVQTITVNDLTAPAITAPANIVVKADNVCKAQNVALGTPATTDNCSPVSVTSNAPASYSLGNTTVTWTATDASGNASTATQVVTVNDSTAPSIACPGNIVVNNMTDSCGAIVNYTLPVVSDNCSGVVNPITNGSFENNYAGWNVSSSNAFAGTFGILGTGQTISNGGQLFDHATSMLKTQASPGLPYTGAPTNGNKMAILLVTGPASHTMYQDITIPTGNPELKFDLQYRNHNGAFDVVNQYFSVVLKNPTTNAVIATLFKTMPGDPLSIPMTAKTINLSAYAGQTVRLSMIQATINNFFFDVLMDNVRIGDGGLQQTAGLASGKQFPVGTTTNTYVATDASGNSSTCSFTVTVNDNQAPSITAPANVTVNADNGNCSATNVALGTPVTKDNCGVQSVTNDALTTYPHGNTTVTWTVTDIHGNTQTATQTVTVVDNQNPVVSCPANVTVSCDASTATTATGVATATDNCGVASVTHSDASTQSANVNDAAHYNYTISRTWTALDVNGNSSSCTQTITVQDVTAPAITCPSNTSVSCDASTAVAANGEATGTDNCSPVAITYSDASTQDANANNAGHYNYVITRTWTATDVTGNFTTCTQTITVQDVTAPVVTCPSNTIVSCDASTAVAANGEATGTDNCSPVAITHSDVSTQDANANNAGHYNYTITRTWTATDVTGNASSCTQTITVQDVTAPVVTCPSNTTVSCDASTAVAANGTATGTDNCSPVAITHSDASTQSANVNSAAHYNYTITRTWTATDVTGNFSTCVQTVTVQDVTAPSIVCPADATVSCKTSVADNGSATGSDNCSPVAITSTDASTQDPNPANTGHYNYTITRTWTATDVTGNATSCNQVITVHALNNAAIAITPVNTINANHQNHTIYLGYGSQSVTLAATANDGVGAYSYSWSPTTGVANPTAATTSVSPQVTTTYTVTITDGTGCTITQSFTVNVIDVRCGNKIKICHYPPGNTNNPQQLCLPASAIPAHLAHGCVLGDCPQSKDGNSTDEEHYDDNINGLVVNEVKVYPNPNNGSFTVELPAGMENANVVITDMAGKVIQKKPAMMGNKLQFDLGGVARGLYMVHVISGNETYRSKISVQ